jgi:hypothetical protein
MQCTGREFSDLHKHQSFLVFWDCASCRLARTLACACFVRAYMCVARPVFWQRLNAWRLQQRRQCCLQTGPVTAECAWLSQLMLAGSDLIIGQVLMVAGPPQKVLPFIPYSSGEAWVGFVCVCVWLFVGRTASRMAPAQKNAWGSDTLPHVYVLLLVVVCIPFASACVCGLCRSPQWGLVCVNWLNLNGRGPSDKALTDAPALYITVAVPFT